MIIFDEIVSWIKPGSEFESKCQIRIIKLDGHGPVVSLKKYYIVATDLGPGSGTSITNSVEYLIPRVCEAHGVDIDKMVWFEHYPHKNTEHKPSLDIVIPTPETSCCQMACAKRVSATWRPARENEVKHLKHFIPDII